MLSSDMDLIIKILLIPHTQLRDLRILPLENLSRILQHTDIALLGPMLLHRLQKRITHRTDMGALNRGVRARLVVFTTGVHPHILLLLLLVLLREILLVEAILAITPVVFAVPEAFEEGLGPREELAGFGQGLRAEAALDEVVGGADEAHAFFDVVHHADVAVGVRAVDEGEFHRRARVAAVEDHEEGALGWESRNERFVEDAGWDLAFLFVVDGDDCAVEARDARAVCVGHLAAVAGVVQEVAGAWFGHEPLHRCQDVDAGWVEFVAGVGVLIVSHDELGLRVGWVALGREELVDVLHILVTARERVAGAHVVDADEERLLLLPVDGWGWIAGFMRHVACLDRPRGDLTSFVADISASSR